MNKRSGEGALAAGLGLIIVAGSLALLGSYFTSPFFYDTLALNWFGAFIAAALTTLTLGILVAEILLLVSDMEQAKHFKFGVVKVIWWVILVVGIGTGFYLTFHFFPASKERVFAELSGSRYFYSIVSLIVGGIISAFCWFCAYVGVLIAILGGRDVFFK